MSTVSTVGGIISIVAVAGGAVFFVASMDSRIRALEEKAPNSNIEAISTAKELALAVIVTEQAKAVTQIQDLSTVQKNEISRLSEEKQDNIRNLIFANASVTIGGVCFKPRMLTRCNRGSDHMTWVDNSIECTGAGYVVEGQIPVLMKCN